MSDPNYILDFNNFKNIWEEKINNNTRTYYCVSCGQVINESNKSNKYISPHPSKSFSDNKYCCTACEKDLDENGLFFEENYIS